MNYIKKVIEESKKIDFTKPAVHHMDIFHDDWCAIFQGKPCNCNPDVKLLPSDKSPKPISKGKA